MKSWNAVSLQDAMDRFVQARFALGEARGATAERCLAMFADYLVNFSDLFGDDEELLDDAPLEEWEQALDRQMQQLFEGDTEPGNDLGPTPLARLTEEHLRDFFAWHMLREVGAVDLDARLLRTFIRAMRDWVGFVHRKGWIGTATRDGFIATLAEVAPACHRAATVARVLFQYVRSGVGTPAELRGHRFTGFVEGHARVAAVADDGVRLRFDSDARDLGDVALPGRIARMFRAGDVIDAELGRRGGRWIFVDVGPVYPGEVYVEAEAFGIEGAFAPHVAGEGR